MVKIKGCSGLVYPVLSFYLGYPDSECGCLNQDGQDKRMFQDWIYPALSFYLGYPDSELFAFIGVSVYNENIHLTI